MSIVPILDERFIALLRENKNVAYFYLLNVETKDVSNLNSIKYLSIKELFLKTYQNQPALHLKILIV